jgi:hypothetical protein
VLCVISPWASFVSHASPLPFTISPIGSSVTSTVGVVSPPSRCSQPFSVGAVSDADHVSASSLKCGRVHFANVVNALHLRPVPREHRQTPGIVFHLQHRLDASPLQSLLETADTTEERDGPHGWPPRFASVASRA